MRTSLVTLLLMAAAAAGCGADPSSAERFRGAEREVADTVEDLQRAAERREAGRICADLLVDQLRERVAAGGSNCENEMAKALDDADAFELDVLEVSVDGAEADATVRGESGERDERRTLHLRKESGRWRIVELDVRAPAGG